MEPPANLESLFCFEKERENLVLKRKRESEVNEPLIPYLVWDAVTSTENMDPIVDNGCLIWNVLLGAIFDYIWLMVVAFSVFVSWYFIGILFIFI